MTVYPEYFDTLTFANIRKGQIPFYILHQRIRDMSPLHHHDFAELSFFIDGHGSETINGKKYDLSPGTVRFLLPQQMHAIMANNKHPLELYCCMFDFNVLFESQADSELCRILLHAGVALPSLNLLTGDSATNMQDICVSLMDEYNSSSIGKNSAIRSRLFHALLLYVRSFSHLPLSSLAAGGNEPKHKDWEIIHFLNSNFLHTMTLHDLSERFEVSPSYISRLFQKYLGRSFLDHLHMLRINRASSLLVTTDMGILQISEEAGFESSRTFSRLFKNKTGLTPSEFRNTYAPRLKD